MNGQMTISNDCEEMARAIERVSNYTVLEPLDFDMRGYANYIAEHNIPIEKIDETIFSMFRTTR